MNKRERDDEDDDEPPAKRLEDQIAQLTARAEAAEAEVARLTEKNALLETQMLTVQRQPRVAERRAPARPPVQPPVQQHRRIVPPPPLPTTTYPADLGSGSGSQDDAIVIDD